MPTIDWLWLTAGLIAGVPLGVMLTLLLHKALYWGPEQRQAVASAKTQVAALNLAPKKPDLSDYPQTTRNGTTLRVIANPEQPDQALSRKA